MAVSTTVALFHSFSFIQGLDCVVLNGGGQCCIFLQENVKRTVQETRPVCFGPVYFLKTARSLCRYNVGPMRKDLSQK